MATDVPPGVYRNTNTGVEFELTVDEDTVTMHIGEGENGFTVEKDRVEFWFNIKTGTYELVEEDDTVNPPRTTAR